MAQMIAMNGRLLAVTRQDCNDLVKEGSNGSEAVCVSCEEIVHAPRERLRNEAVDIRQSQDCGGEDGDEGVNVDVGGSAGVFESELG